MDTVNVLQDVLLAVVGTEGFILVAILIADHRYRRLRDKDRRIRQLEDVQRAQTFVANSEAHIQELERQIREFRAEQDRKKGMTSGLHEARTSYSGDVDGE